MPRHPRSVVVKSVHFSTGYSRFMLTLSDQSKPSDSCFRQRQTPGKCGINDDINLMRLSVSVFNGYGDPWLQAAAGIPLHSTPDHTYFCRRVENFRK